MAKIVLEAALSLEFTGVVESRVIHPGGADDTYDPPEGYQLISWGFNDGNQDIRVTKASIFGNRFSYIVQNHTTDDIGISWFFNLLKVD